MKFTPSVSSILNYCLRQSFVLRASLVMSAFLAIDNASADSKRILLLSIDGMHALDLARFVKNNTNSTLASLMRNAVNYTTASCAKPADSFPGMMAMATGGSPISTGVYFDLSYDRSLWPPGVTSGPTGTPVVYNETITFNPNAIDGGGGLNPNLMPRLPPSGAVVYPHNYLRVNTIFEVIKAAGYRTAWSDKHLADEMIQGPSGQGVDDLYLLEINGNNACAGCTVSTTKSLDAAKAFDDLKVKGITNQISGLDHAGTTNVGVPTIFGMNFQAVSVAQRLKVNLQINGVTPAPFPFGGPGGYLDGSGTPSLLLSNALSYTDASIGTIVNALQANGLLASTYIIITAKHGQAPIDPTKLNIVNATNITGVVGPVNNVLQSSGDDALLLWLQNQSNTAAAVSALLNNQANASIQDIWANDLLKLHFPDPTLDPRTPDMIVIGKPGTIYAPKNNKIAEHGGFNDQDVNVPLFISSPSLPAQTIKIPVATAQLAPTILQLLGLNPFALQAVQIEKTAVLPGFEAVEVGGSPPATFSSTIYRSNGQAQFQLSTANAQQFVIQASTDLTNWTPIGTNTLVVGGSATITDLQAGSFSNRFYRAQTP